MNTPRRLLDYFRPYWILSILIVICTIFIILTTLAIPWIIGKDLIDSVILGEKSIKLLSLIALGIVVLVAFKGLFSYGQNYLMSLVGFRVITNIRNQVYEHLQRLSLNFYRKRRTGEIVSRVINDVDQLQNALINTAVGFVTNFFMLIGILGLILYIHWHLSLFV